MFTILISCLLLFSCNAEDSVKEQFPKVQKRLLTIMNKVVLPRQLKSEQGKLFQSAIAEKLGANGVVFTYFLDENFDPNDKRPSNFIIKLRDQMVVSNKNDPEMVALMKAGFIFSFRIEKDGKVIDEKRIPKDPN